MGFSGYGVKKVITTVPCRKHGKQEFVRTQAGEKWRLDTLLLEDNEDREYYLVASELRDHVIQTLSSLGMLQP